MLVPHGGAVRRAEQHRSGADGGRPHRRADAAAPQQRRRRLLGLEAHTARLHFEHDVRWIECGGGTPFSTQVAAASRQALGTRAVVADHDLDDPIITTDTKLYGEFQALYAAAQAVTPHGVSPLGFQTPGSDH